MTLGLRPDLQFGSDVNFSVADWVRMHFNYDQGDLPFLCNAVGSTFSVGFVFAPSYGPNGTQGSGTAPGGWAWSIFDSGGNGVGVYGEVGSINDGEWHHLVHTFDRTGKGITYLDGVPATYTVQGGTAVSAAGDIDTGAPISIGQDPTGKYPEAGAADIDDLRIWRRALTPLEVVGIYLAGATNGVSFGQGTLTISIQVSGNQLQLVWPAGTLQSADDVTGQFVDQPTATSPFLVTPSAARKFYRVKF